MYLFIELYLCRDILTYTYVLKRKRRLHEVAEGEAAELRSRGRFLRLVHEDRRGVQDLLGVHLKTTKGHCTYLQHIYICIYPYIYIYAYVHIYRYMHLLCKYVHMDNIFILICIYIYTHKVLVKVACQDSFRAFERVMKTMDSSLSGWIWDLQRSSEGHGCFGQSVLL